MKTEDYIEKIDGAERRFFKSTLEMRAEDGKEYFEGTAAVIGDIADLGWFTEEILPGAFDEVMNDDVRALFNHDADQVLGRTKSKTLVLTADSTGLHYRALYNEKDPDHVRAMEKVKRGDVAESSFSFDVKNDKWSTRNGKDHRQIEKFKALYDVAPVTYPAYPKTTVAARSMEKAKKPAEPVDDYKKDLAEMDQDFMRLDLKTNNNKK